MAFEDAVETPPAGDVPRLLLGRFPGREAAG